MRLPIDTASVKFAAAGPAEPVFDSGDVATMRPSDLVPTIGMSQTTYEECDSFRVASSSRNGGTLGELFEFDKIDRPLGPQEQLLFNVVEVTNILSLSRTKVYELLYAGKLPSVKIGASRRVRRADLEKFVSNLELAD